jgi:hypothetical protein
MHGHTRTHKTHHGPNLGEATDFFLILFSMIIHKGCTKMSFCHRTPKLGIPKFLEFPKLGLMAFLRIVTSCMIEVRSKEKL